ncbi:hypothetical protein CEG14_16555 [Bordetella genomosp. 1]|uniref:Heavy metal translocating P-type ATPase n=1 Tax=Bordetella genomosp. 1 TaxID=1395607 RepID=A0A261SJ46_9BORD|nr:hypothetical protein [Bordetella genomosp. 1]OZI36790.1 hypothetical protein CEG14_16555 [Bordetella genomosp. 1]
MAAARRPAASIFAQPAALAPAERQVRRHALARLGVSWLVMMQVMMLAWPGYLRGQAMPDDAAFTLDRAIVLMNWASLVLTVPVVLYCAWPLWRGAWASLRQARAGMDVPVALGIVGAFLPSAWATWRQAGEVYFDSVTMFVAFLLAARYLELCARQRVGGADAAALGAARDGAALDSAALDSAALDSAALAQRADRVAARFVTLQVLLALLAGAGWAWVEPAHAVPVMVALLVMSCPCAMAMAVPATLAAARAALLQAERDGDAAALHAIPLRARRIALQNLYGSLIWHLLMVPPALVGWVTPWLAALAMLLSTVAVALNAWRLARRRAPRAAAPLAQAS